MTTFGENVGFNLSFADGRKGRVWLLQKDHPGEAGAKVPTVWMEVQLDTDWVAAYRLEVQAGVLVVGELRVFPAELNDARAHGRPRPRDLEQVPPGGLRSRLLRDLKTVDHRAAFGKDIDEIYRFLGDEWGAQILDRHALRTVKHPVPHPGRKGHPDEYFARICRDYVELVRKDPHPIDRLSRAYAMSPGGIRSILTKARKKGILEPPSKVGAAGGDLTEYGRQLIAPKARQSTKKRQRRGPRAKASTRRRKQ